MLELRPIIIDENNIVLGGNMRLKACQELGLKDVPTIYAKDLTEDQKKEFIIKDNVGFGEWNWDDLANDWDSEKLTEWSLDVWQQEQEPELDDLIGEEKNKPPTMKITFETPEQLQKAEIDIQELLDRKYPKAYFSVSAGEL
jgi:ParB-like chromosome segregation protein Spo0J